MTTISGGPGDDSAAQASAQIGQAREELMGGRGSGASDAEVLAHTRDRVMVAGETATRRLEMAARQTGYARRDAAAITRTAQLTQAELAETVAGLVRRLHPRRLVTATETALGRQVSAHPMSLVLGCALLVLAIRRRHRTR